MNTLRLLGTRIRILRQQAGLTQAELAEQCNLSNNFIALLERGRSAPSITTLDKLARALKVTIAELFDFESGGNRQQERDRVMRKLSKLKRVRDLRLVGEMAEFLSKNR